MAYWLIGLKALKNDLGIKLRTLGVVGVVFVLTSLQAITYDVKQCGWTFESVNLNC